MGFLVKTGSLILGASGVATAAPANDTNENILATINIPQLPANALIVYRVAISQTNNANVKSMRLRLGGIAGTDLWGALSVASQARYCFDGVIQNRGATNSQVAHFMYGATAFASAAAATASIDTSAPTTLVITAQKATGTDTVTLESYYAALWLP